MRKGAVYQEDTIIINVYASNNKSSRYMKQRLTEPKGEMDKFIIGDFNNLLSVIDRKSRQKLLRI